MKKVKSPYTINKNGIIACDGVPIVMQESNLMYQQYVKFLREGGSVEETADRTNADLALELLNHGEESRINNKIIREITTLVPAEPVIDQDPLNVKMGKNALIKNTKGIDNVATGPNALMNNISSGNTASGKSSQASNKEGANNTSNGRGSLAGLVRGNGNVGVGNNAGRLSKNNKNLVVTNKSIFIGENTKSLEETSDNEIVVGSDTIGRGKDTTTIGNEKTKTTKLYGEVIADNYTFSDGTKGISATFATIDGLTITVKNGLITSISKK